MSRSNPSADSVSPVQRYFRWAGGTGHVEYYDKQKDETVQVKLPFIFLVLDQLSAITGYMEGKGGFWSNEVRRTTDEPFVVRSKQGVEFEGMYKDLNVKGAKFANSVYLAYKDEEGQLQIGNIKFSGAAVSEWINFAKGTNVNKVAIAITGSTDDKKGNVEFKRPVFAAVQADEATESIAIELDQVLQEYLTNRPASAAPRASERAEREIEADDVDAEQRVIDAANDQHEPEQGELDLNSIKF